MDGRSHVTGPSHCDLVLVVEDDARAQRLLRLTLEPVGYRLLFSETVDGVVDVVTHAEPDLVLLDLKLPGSDSFALCRMIRTASTVPLILLSALDQPTDKIRGFEEGADDYLTKPYDPAELVARIAAVLRRARGQPRLGRPLFRCDGLLIDFDQHRVMLHGTELQLTRTEYRLLAYLARNAGRTMVADAILAHVWGREYIGEYAPLHLYISRLRRKLGDTASQRRFIITRPGVGYLLTNGTTGEQLRERTA
jgi:two-component system response regulator VicR